MDTGLMDIFTIALVVIPLGLMGLLLMVYRELGPFSGLPVAGRWMLMAAFGMGIFAFCLKMAVAVLLTRMPQQTVAVLVASYPQRERQQVAEADSVVMNAVLITLPDHYIWQVLPRQAPAPADNPTTVEKVALGKRLFFEPRLSADSSLSCSSCHSLQEKAGADGRRTALGIDKQIGARNTPTVWNAAFQSVLFWDGRASSLEEQAKGPILNPIEMGMPSGDEAVRRLMEDASYRKDFVDVFGVGPDVINFGRIAAAIAAYERTLITPDTPYDRFVAGNREALRPSQLRGMALFESLGCTECHRGPNFSDASLLGGYAPLRLFPTVPGAVDPRLELTRDSGIAVRGQPGVWRIPSLRNVALTGPYFHNGSVDKLSDAVRIMASAQLGIDVLAGYPAAPTPTPKPTIVWSADKRQIGSVSRRVIGDREVDDIVAFLNALSSDSLVSKTTVVEP